MKKTLAFTLAILLVLPVFLAWGQTDEGYGEDETALGQFVDSFEASDNVSVAINVIRNTTLEAMELNRSNLSNLFNMSEYTHIDVDNKVVVYDSNITWANYERDDSGRTVYDYGVDTIGDIILDIDVNVTRIEAGDADTRNFGSIFVLSQTDAIARSNDEIQFGLRQVSDNDNKYLILFYMYDGAGNDINVGTYQFDVGTEYYFTMNRSGADKNLMAFSDNARTNLLEKLDVSIGNDRYRYIALMKISPSAVDGSDDSDGYIRNFNNATDGRTGYSIEGYFTTTDYMSDPSVNGSTLVSMVNTSIPGNTDIKLQFSENNITWGDNEGTVGNSIDLLGGLESFELRSLNYSNGYYSRFNLSTTDVSITPLVYQNRLITTIGMSSVTSSISTNWGLLWFFLILICVPILLVLLKGSKR